MANDLETMQANANKVSDEVFAQLESQAEETYDLPQVDTVKPVKSKVKTASEKKSSKIRSKKSEDKAILRDIPKSIIAECRHCFSSCKNQTDAVVAYLYAFCPGIKENEKVKSEMTPEQLELVNNVVEDPSTVLSDRILLLQKKIDKLVKSNEKLTSLLLYMISDKMGLPVQSDVKMSTTFTELSDTFLNNPKFEEFADAFEPVYEEYRRRKAVREGRPYNY